MFRFRTNKESQCLAELVEVANNNDKYEKRRNYIKIKNNCKTLHSK